MAVVIGVERVLQMAVGALRCERATVEEVGADVISVAEAVFGIEREALLETGRAPVAVLACDVGGECGGKEIGRVWEGAAADMARGELGVPGIEQVSGAGLALPPGAPVVAIPVAVANIGVEDHVVDEGVDIEVVLDGAVGRVGLNAAVGEIHHRIEGDKVTVGRCR